MTKALPALLLIFALSTTASAQSRVHEKDLTGTWKLVFQLDSAVEETDGALARIALRAVSGIMDEIDIRFEFLDGHRLKVTSSALDEDPEVEYSDWEINDRGQLILGDNDHIQMDDDVWMFSNGHLSPYEKKGNRWEQKESIHLERVRGR